MIRRLGLFGLLFAVANMIFAVVGAQEGYNPAPFTPEDNACYEGGSMWRENPEDGCISDWHWECGWYLARYENGVFSDNDMPSWCNILFVEGEFNPNVALPENASCGYSVSGSASVERAIVNRAATNFVNVSFDWGIPISGQFAVAYTVDSGGMYFYGVGSSATSHSTSINNGSNFVRGVTANIVNDNEQILFSVACRGLG